MLKVIEDEHLIRKYAKLFAWGFKPFTDETIKVKLGHQGASFSAKVNWSKKLGIWTFSQATKDVRYWNAFGTGKPQKAGNLPITAEINFPWTGIDRKTGAAFAQDEQNNIYVVHRGKIGGGKRGVGKSLFEENYRGVWAWMEDGGMLSQVAVVGVLASGRFALQVAQFVIKIEKLKSFASFSPQTLLNFSEVSFREDFVGLPPDPDFPVPIQDCDHDSIVRHLALLLQRWKFKVGNDTQIDLFLMQPGSDRISHVINVCAGGDEKSVLAAAAKLLLRQSADDGCPSAVLIVREEFVSRYVQLLQKIHVEVLGCRLEGERIIFPDLGKIRLDQN